MSDIKKKGGKTLFALGAGYLIDRSEEQAMGVLSPVIQAVFGVNYSMLGLMTTLRTIAQTISAPFWGYAADRFSRKKVLLFGTGIWGLWTIAVGLMPSFNGILIIRVLSGLGLGAFMPAAFSLLADYYPPHQRGRALGTVGAIGMMGVVLGVLALGFVASEELWRWGFIGLGACSVLTGLLIWWLVDEIPAGSSEPEIAQLVTEENSAQYSSNIKWKDVFSVLRIPTIWVAIAQGITGTMPWVVMGMYMINWMVNNLGFSNGITFTHERGSAPLTFAAIIIGSAVGNYLGGVIGDFADRKNSKYGRTIIGQFSVIVGIPLTYILFTQAQNMSALGLFAFSFMIAMLITWPGRGAKEPMMQAVVLPEIRASAYSVVNLIEGGLSAFSGLIAGALADKIGLTKALLWTVPFPWVLCAVFFTLFYFTYPRDLAKVHAIMNQRREKMLKEAKEATWDAEKIKTRIGQTEAGELPTISK
jgi:MFS family permease